MFEAQDDGEADGDGGTGPVPMSFASRGSKQHEEQSKAVSYKWRALFCKLCGLRGASRAWCIALAFGIGVAGPHWTCSLSLWRM